MITYIKKVTNTATFSACHYCAVSPTNINQYNLPPGNSGSMSRSNSIPAQDSFDLYGEGHPLGGSATSLEDRPRAISRSGSFRDSTDEGKTVLNYEPENTKRIERNMFEFKIVNAFLKCHLSCPHCVSVSQSMARPCLWSPAHPHCTLR